MEPFPILPSTTRSQGWSAPEGAGVTHVPPYITRAAGNKFLPRLCLLGHHLMPEAWRSIAPAFVQVRTTAGTPPKSTNASFIPEARRLFPALRWVQISWSISTNPFYGFFGFIPGLSVRRSICFGKNVPEIYTCNYTGNLSDREF